MTIPYNESITVCQGITSQWFSYVTATESSLVLLVGVSGLQFPRHESDFLSCFTALNARFFSVINMVNRLRDQEWCWATELLFLATVQWGAKSSRKKLLSWLRKQGKCIARSLIPISWSFSAQDNIFFNCILLHADTKLFSVYPANSIPETVRYKTLKGLRAVRYNSVSPEFSL